MIFVRLLAWYHARPARDRTGGLQPTRLESIRLDLRDPAYEPEMPVVLAGEHIIECLFAIGPTLASGLGPCSLTYQEINAYMQSTGTHLQPWEIKILRHLSNAYVSESYKSTDANCPPPWQPRDVSQENRDAISKKISDTMRSLIMSRKDP